MRAGASGQGLGWVSVNVGGPGAGGGGGYRGADGLDAGDDRGAGATSATMGAGCFAGAVVPTAADASKNGGVRDVPVYLVTEANTDVLLGCSLPTVTGGVIGGVRGEGHDSAVRGAR
ncbi:hypothetical protein [Nocardia caishijiensis]|nr:hypothetical protein [Nocardia caishijiensis]